jgi:hypothetical protein
MYCAGVLTFVGGFMDSQSSRMCHPTTGWKLLNPITNYRLQITNPSKRPATANSRFSITYSDFCALDFSIGMKWGYQQTKTSNSLFPNNSM